MDNISKLIADKKGYDDLVGELAELKGTDLNSLLLEVFRKRAMKLSPTELLKHFQQNRFAAHSTVDTIAFKEFEIRCLKLTASRGFTPITLSPLTVFGTCSSVGFVDQNNVMTALRGTEVVSDATNVFALLIAKECKNQKNTSVMKYAAAHRHVRTQGLINPAFTPHFSIFCLATGGSDRGSFSFELEQLVEHIDIHFAILENELRKEKLILKIYFKDENKTFRQAVADTLKNLNKSIRIEIENQPDTGDYYKLIRFKFFIDRDGNEMNLSDGGFVDWTQKLIPNKKHRLLTSGIGTELVHKVAYNQI